MITANVFKIWAISHLLFTFAVISSIGYRIFVMINSNALKSVAEEKKLVAKAAKKEAKLTIVRNRSTVTARLKEIWKYRELLIGMTRKELKVKYKNSVLGFLWTMLNPALYTIIFWLVFTKFLPNGIPEFVIFFLSGLLVWNLFTNALTGATSSVVGNAPIVKKVYFPREILPLSSVGAALIHYLLQLIVLVTSLIIFKHNIDWHYAWLMPLALITIVVFSTACGIFLSAINVYARDTQHLLELVLLAWFWATPVVYAYGQVDARGGLIGALFKFNPITNIVVPFQRAIYAHTDVESTGKVKTILHIIPEESSLWYLRNIFAVFVVSLCLFYIAMKVFDKAQGNFAEEL